MHIKKCKNHLDSQLFLPDCTELNSSRNSFAKEQKR